METTPVNGVIDIIGVVESVGDYMDITLKNGSATHKRSVQLKDQSNASIEVRLQQCSEHALIVTERTACIPNTIRYAPALSQLVHSEVEQATGQLHMQGHTHCFVMSL